MTNKHIFIRPKTSVLSVAKNLFNQRNPRLIKDLRLFKALYNCRDTFTDVMSPLQIRLFMQNKANFRKSQMNVNKVLTKDYEKRTLGEHGKKQSQTKPNKANLLNAQMNVNKVLTKDYENMSNWAICENKPNSNPNKANQTQSEIPNQKSQIHSHPAGNKLHTPRRQSWGCFDLSGRATPKTAGLGFSLRYYSRTTDKI